MTFGEKLSKLRKENNYTQEQLAEILNVSRQSVSKWESDIAFPETDKLIQIGKLFNCSMDYLLKDDITETRPPQASNFTEFTDEIGKIGKKLVSNKSQKKLKKILIIVGIVFGVITVIFLIAYISAIIKIGSLRVGKIESPCYYDSCNSYAIDGGYFCEDHTCIIDGCNYQRETKDKCFYHSYVDR